MKLKGEAEFIIKLLYCSIFFGVLLFFGSKTALASDDHLVINEVYPCPKTGEIEWIELYNPTELGIDLSNFSIEDGTHVPKILIGYTVAPNSYLILNKSINFTFGLNNEGDTVILKNIGLIIDQVTYGSFDDGDKTNNVEAPAQGKSIARYPNGKDTDVDNIDFTVMISTISSENIKPVYLDNIIISEILPNPSDGQEEFIEIFNNSDIVIDLSSWQIDDIEGGGSPFLISENTLIQPGAYLVFYKTVTSIYLNDDSDNARLLDPNGNIKNVITYDKTYDGQSYILFNNIWQWTQKTTPGEINQLLISQDKKYNNEIITIEEARAKENGEEVTVIGTVTALPGVLSSQYFYIQDQTGGIQIYCYSKTFPELKLGDSISVTGELSETNNERRVKIRGADSIIILNHIEPVVPAEITISEINEKNEGTYIKTMGIVIQTSGDTFYISDGQTEIKVVINKSTGIEKPKMKKGDQVEVTGIISQYKEEYRILPIDQNDVKIIASEGQLPRAGGTDLFYFIISLFLSILWNIYLKAKRKPTL